VLWVVLKVVKAALWMLFLGLVVAAGLTAVWLFLK
jgi:hypothetical protein